VHSPFPLFRLPSLTGISYSSLEDHSRIIAPLKVPQLWAWPDSIFNDYLFDHHPAPLPRPQPDLVAAWDICDAYVHQLNAFLAYAPLSRTIEAVEAVLRGLDALEAYLADLLTRILDHPSYSTYDIEWRTKRADTNVMNIILYRFLTLSTLHATQVALSKAGAPVELLDDGRRRIYETLNDVADLALLDMVRYRSLFLRDPFSHPFPPIETPRNSTHPRFPRRHAARHWP
jgi:hypothetical protein